VGSVNVTGTSAKAVVRISTSEIKNCPYINKISVASIKSEKLRLIGISIYY
jgi:hypothetical protein